MITMGPFRTFGIVIACFLAVLCFVLGDEVSDQPKCQDLCARVNNGCTPGPDTKSEEEVIVVTNGKKEITSWSWDSIDMVVSSYVTSTPDTQTTACTTHSMRKRFGLRQPVPENVTALLIDGSEVSAQKFQPRVKTIVNWVVADRIVYDLLDFFVAVNNMTDNKTDVIAIMAEVMKSTTLIFPKRIQSEVYCIVPWEPPCDYDCSGVSSLLSQCHILILSPDSYMPMADIAGNCIAAPAVPIAKFLYGIDRYIELRPMRGMGPSIVAGIAWHGYKYECDELKGEKCIINGRPPKQECFDDGKKRTLLSLSDIHRNNLEAVNVKLDVINKGVYYTDINKKTQLWFDNFTTMAIKYDLVKDLNLRGISLWYGEDLMIVGIDPDSELFTLNSWNFLTHSILHKATFKPTIISHYYADTVAGAAIGCLLLGVALGVTFTCIGFKRGNCSKRNRPFKLDEQDDDFRDDEGL